MTEKAPAPSVAIVALTRYGVHLALQLQPKIAGSVCYVPVRHHFALAMGACGFEKLAQLFSDVWCRHSALICIMASGIVVRHIAPLLKHKTRDPAVVVLDERGRYAISLVSGHLGGANELARSVAQITGGQAVITTASDVQGKPALDLIAREAELEIENLPMLARVERALLEDEPLWIFDPEGLLEAPLARQSNIIWFKDRLSDGWQHRGEGYDVEPTPDAGAQAQSLKEAFGSLRETPGIWVSERLAPSGLTCLQLRSRNLVVGIGCNRGTPAGEILELIQQSFKKAELSLLSIRNLSSIDLKCDEPGLLAAAKALERPVRFFSKEQIAPLTVPNPSNIVERHIGVQSVCEATALMSAQNRELILPKQKTPNVTLAVARVASQS